MWETIKKALTGITEATGIEIPGLPVDLGAVGDAATTGVQSLTESATGLTETASGVVESATSATDVVSETPIGDALPK
ncbi:hypothetical protein [Pengzhenrongella phosphoraccumulans]|uniref:hypothetical protein n=1 Tax=Pengzhenrongella phosphoraccumulans TaxID=3114394 RepID=UPI00388F6DAA